MTNSLPFYPLILWLLIKMPLSLPTQTQTWVKHAADSGQSDAQVMLHLLNRADANDQDVAKFLDHYSRFLGSYSKNIAALCRRLEALERGANLQQQVVDPEVAQGDPMVDDDPIAPAATGGGLVEQLRTAVRPSGGSLMDDEWQAVIREVAAWLDTRGQHGCSVLLREEINR